MRKLGEPPVWRSNSEPGILIPSLTLVSTVTLGKSLSLSQFYHLYTFGGGECYVHSVLDNRVANRGEPTSTPWFKDPQGWGSLALDLYLNFSGLGYLQWADPELWI